MRPLHTRLLEARTRLGVPWEVLERDYLLSWILAGIARVPGLRDSIAFKGGTALKKCFFGDYRFSEDLDFSGLRDAPRGDALDRAICDVCTATAELLGELAPVEVLHERYTEKHPHPGGQEAFSIRARFPWHTKPHTRVIIEVSVDEEVLKPTKMLNVIHEYGEPFTAQVQVYALEEVVAEKLRAILQHVARLDARGWSRSRARDYYDLWRILSTYRDRLDFKGFDAFLQRKCATRNVSFAGPEDFFQERMLVLVEKTWDQWLGPLVRNLPHFTTVVGELRLQVETLTSWRR